MATRVRGSWCPNPARSSGWSRTSRRTHAITYKHNRLGIPGTRGATTLAFVTKNRRWFFSNSDGLDLLSAGHWTTPPLPYPEQDDQTEPPGRRDRMCAAIPRPRPVEGPSVKGANTMSRRTGNVRSAISDVFKKRTDFIQGIGISPPAPTSPELLHPSNGRICA